MKESLSHRDAEFGRNGNLEGDVRVQEVGEVQSVEGSLVDRLQTQSAVQPSGGVEGEEWRNIFGKLSHVTQIQEVIEEDESHVLQADRLQRQKIPTLKKTNRLCWRSREEEIFLWWCWWWWPHPAGQPGLVEGLVGGDELGVTQQRHRQPGRHAALQVSGRRRPQEGEREREERRGEEI